MSLTTVSQYKRMVYLAHRVAGDVEANVERASFHFKKLLDMYRPSGTYIIAPWMYEVRIYEEADPAQREQGLENCKFMISKCDELWIIRHPGEKISSGCAMEGHYMLEQGKPVREMVYFHPMGGYQVQEFRQQTTWENHVQATQVTE